MPDAEDVVLLMALGMVFGGFWWIWPPLALVVGGGLILAWAVWYRMRRSEAEK